MVVGRTTVVAVFFLLGTLMSGLGAQLGRVALRGHVPAAVAGLAAKGRLSTTNQLSLAIGLPLRNEAELDELLRQLYDPASTNFHKFLSPAEFTARFGPTEADYAAVRQFAESNGFTVTGTPDSRLLLDVSGSAAAVEKSFHIILQTYRHPSESRDFFAPDIEPTVQTGLCVTEVSGLTDYYRLYPKSHLKPITAQSGMVAKFGSAPAPYANSYIGDDFRNAYVPGTTLTGAGQMVGLVQFDGFYSNDIAAYATAAGGGRTNIVIQTVLLDNFNGVPTTGANSGNGEVSLDIELAMAMAPGLSKIVVFEAPNSPTYFNDVLNAMASTNTYPLLNNLSCSWGGSNPRSFSAENIFKKMAAQGQSFFNASGDSDAFTGSVLFPSESTNITQVGGTTLSMNGTGNSYETESVWNWNYVPAYSAYKGSSGGISTSYAIPFWQQGISMVANHGSTTMRNIPDVALTSDDVYVVSGGSAVGLGGWGGTSCAAPLWAGFMALVNEQAAAAGHAPVGFVNPTVYAIGKSSCYNACFHDITTGSNTWSGSPTNYYAVPGYDLCTGWGTPNGTNLINALIWPPPTFTSQPSGKTVTNGVSVTFSATASSTTAQTYFWLFNNTNLADGGNISGSTSNVLTITSATTNNSGSYLVVASNLTGAVTSSVAILNVGYVPVISTPPSSQTNYYGSNVIFSATITGSSPLSYQWRKNGTNLANGTGIAGATSNLLTLTAVTTNASGAYSLKATNIFGSVTSSVANLLVVVPPVIASSSLTDRLIQCGDNTNIFSITATGTAPLAIQWSLDGAAIPNATNTSFGSTNLTLNLPSHTISVTVTNLYGSATSNALLVVTDTLPPVITLFGSSRMTNELGSTFTDPGATATDTCAGTNVTLLVNGTVNPSAVGTYTLTYLATDTSGNASTNTRIVVVRDTTPPVILQSFTNLVLAADTNCSAVMPDVTGTNFISATDLSGAVTISQSPTNTAILLLGTNVVVITVADVSGNPAYSTNQIVVQDQTLPQILSEPPSQTNLLGETVTFTTTATACTPVAFQWYFNAVALPAQTNNSLTCSDLTLAAAGNYFVTVTAAGGSSTSAVATLTVTLLPSTVTLATSANPSGYQDNLIFTASVAPANATGTVQFLTNGTAFDLEPLVAGFAISTNLAALPRGTNLIAAAYSGDTDYLPATNTLAQIVTNHPPVADDIYFSRAAGALLNIAITNLASYWSDADGDPVSLAAVGISTNGVVLTNLTGTLVYSNFNNVADQFVCTLTDGWGGTNFQTVYISIMLPSIANVAASPGGGLQLQLAGATGLTYVLEATTSLFPANWQPVATNTLNGSGQWNYNPLLTNSPNCFYRLKLVQ